MRLSPIRATLKTQSLEEWFWRLVFVGVCCDGMVYREIATRTLDTRLRVIKAGTEGGEEPWLEAPITCHGHRTLPSTPPRFSGSYLPLSKGMTI